MITGQPVYTVRQATEADLLVLTELKTPLALHKDRLWDADGSRLLYLVVEQLLASASSFLSVRLVGRTLMIAPVYR